MMEESLKKLQNGSDIRGTALDSPAGEKVNLTPEIAGKIASAFILWLRKKTGKDALRVSIGRDSRLSSPALLNGAAGGMTGLGADVADFGLCSTPAMFMSTVMPGYEYDGAVMVTASHLPFQRNGLKFFTKDGGLEKAEIGELLEIAAQGSFPHCGKPGALQKRDFLPAYAAHLADVIRSGVNDPEHYEKPLAGMKIVVDAGNGAGGFFAHGVLEPLGADITGSRFLEPDGRFPNHVPNPEDENAMRSICGAVLESHADLGVIFDTDVDRAGAVDKDGREINRNRIVALASAVVLEEHPGTTVVTDSITSDELKTFIEQSLGGKHRRFKRGYKNVINEGIRLNKEGTDCWLAIETSGHAALKENYFLDDGAYLVSKILIKAARLRREGKTVDMLLNGLREPAEAMEFRFDIKTGDFRAYGESVLQKLAAYAAERPDFHVAPDNYEGIRVSFDRDNGNGWFLLRMSLHDPVMPLNVESAREGGVKIIARKLYAFLRNFDGLRLDPIERYVGTGKNC